MNDHLRKANTSTVGLSDINIALEDLLDNITGINKRLANVTEMTDTPSVELNIELVIIIAFITTALITISSCVLNFGVIFLTVREKMAEKDFRTIYYTNLALADLVTGIHTGLNTATLALPNVAFFKNIIVCAAIQGTGSSSICISNSSILLLLFVQYITIKHPYNDSKFTTTNFAKLSCSFVWLFAFAIYFLPFIWWHDNRWTLEKCSIQTAYGDHYEGWKIIVTCWWFGMSVPMLTTQGLLLWEIRQTHKKGTALTKANPKSETGNGQSVSLCKKIREAVISRAPDPNQTQSRLSSNEKSPPGRSSTDSSNKSFSEYATEGSMNGNAKTVVNGDPGYKNGFLKVATAVGKIPRSPTTGRDRNGSLAIVRDVVAHLQEAKYKRQMAKFRRSVKTISMFVLAFVIFNYPYCTVTALSVFCPECVSPEVYTRGPRILVACLFYLNGVANPILYTLRFKVFRAALKKTLGCQ